MSDRKTITLGGVEYDNANYHAETIAEPTSEIFQELLNLVDDYNRKRDVRHVAFLKDEYTNGRWIEDGEPFVITKKGSLIEGQHRAEVAPKMPIIVIFGAHEDAFKTRANCRGRNINVVASIEKFPDPCLTNAMCGWLINGFDKLTRGGRLSVTVRDEFLRLNGQLFEEARHFSKKARSEGSRNLPPALCGSLFFLFSKIDKDRAREFLLCVMDCEDTGSPAAFALRKRLRRNRKETAKLPSRDIAALTIKAWNIGDGEVGDLVWKKSVGEPFPEIKAAR